MKNYKFIILASLFLFASSLQAQEAKDSQTNSILDNIGGSVEVRSKHLWRGLEVSEEANLATDLHFKTKDGSFKLGLWGGMGFTGKFKEFDYYASYSVAGLTFAVWDIYNFSPGATYNNDQAFNYKASETGHFIDASVAYQLQGRFPLKLYYSTIIFGRDRGPLNDGNKYSTFVQLEYPLINQNGLTLDASVAGAFSYKTKAHFYGKTGGIVDIRLRLAKDFMIAGYKLPVYVMPMWNPQGDNVNFQIGATLFTL